MSKTSYALIGIMLAALMYMGAARLYEWVAQRRALQEIAAQNDGDPFAFQQLPVSLAAPDIEPMQKPVKYRPQYPQIYLEDTPLSAADQARQAQETVSSIIDDFNQEQALAQFNQDLQAATQGRVQGLADLSTQSLPQLLQHNPEIAHVVAKHAKNPDFNKILQEIFANPQFQQSVRQLQGNSAVLQNSVPREP